MKNLINFRNVSAIALLSISSIVGFSAFTQDKASAPLVSYYWYDASTGDLLSSTPSENSPNGCIEPTGSPCARGFLAETDNPNTDTPAKIVHYSSH